MTCLEVRDRLAEHTLGVLAPSEARDVKRHLNWCGGCRKESDDLREGVASVALALPLSEPAPLLEARVVEQIQTAAGKRSPAPRRRGIQAFAAATMAAVLVALVAVGWAVAERSQAQDVKGQLNEKIESLEKFFGTSGSFEATLLPTKAVQGSNAVPDQDEGRALIYSAPRASDFILVDVFVAQSNATPYTFRLVDQNGKTISGGELRLARNGELIFFESSGLDLSKGYAISVMDRTGQIILTGTVHPASGS